MSSPVEIVVGGRSYKVVASSPPEEVHRLAAVVDKRLRQVGASNPNALILVALSLAHDLEEASSALSAVTDRSRDMLGTLLDRVEDAIGNVDEHGDVLERL